MAPARGTEPLPPPDLPVPERSGGSVREAADGVLARAEFREDEPTLLERARDEVFDRLGEVVDDVSGGPGGQLLAWVVVGVLTAAAVLLAVRATSGLRRDPGLAAPVPLVRRRTAADWRAEAEASEAAGRWRAGLRCRYRALVADLAERGLVEEVPGRTAGEYRRQVEGAVPAVAPDFGGATGLFEAAWYGGRPTGADEAARFRDHEQRVLAGTR